VPAKSATLKTGGIFEYVRHPIYAGLLLLCFGLGVVTSSAPRLILTAILWYVLDQKVTVEEKNLAQRYPEYPAYMEKVTGKLLPSFD